MVSPYGDPSVSSCTSKSLLTYTIVCPKIVSETHSFVLYNPLKPTQLLQRDALQHQTNWEINDGYETVWTYTKGAFPLVRDAAN